MVITDEEGRPFKENGVYKTRPNDFRETWAAMEKIYLDGGKVKAIGVSNFSIKKYVLACPSVF